jgi:cob(I)alamin adenosyltransferase
MSIATRKGDDGTTGLLFGQRVAKDHPQIEVVGTFDELNVALGAIRPLLTDSACDNEIRDLVLFAQKKLIALMGEVVCSEADVGRYLASKFEKLQAEDVTRLDEAVAQLEGRGLKFDGWATPGATPRAAAIEMARVTARRAERRLTALPAHGRNVRPEVRQFVNRLSDLLWLLAREAENQPDVRS